MSEKKKILLVTNGFYPEISPRSYRATELVKEFCRQGHQVTVITKYRNYDYSYFINEFPIIHKMWRKHRFPSIPYIKRQPFSFLSRAISRMLSLLFEYPSIEEMYMVKSMLKHEKGYNLMISFAVPYTVHWGVAWSRNGKNNIASTWVADCGDPYMLARLDSFSKPFYFKGLELNFCRKCDYISVPFKDMEKQFYPQFIHKIKVIPQGVNFKEIQLDESSVKKEKPVFMFAGTVIPGKRDLTLFLDFLSSLSPDFLFVVYTNQQEWYKKYTNKLGDRMLIMNYIERKSLIYEMSKADFLVNVDTLYDRDLHIEAIPSKLIDYKLANRPILNINSAYLDQEMVIEFLNGNYSRQRIIDISEYEIAKVASRFLDLIR
jgi:hypothetical protein